MTEKMRYLRVKRDGFIFEWNPILAENPDVEEVTEEQAFPERFIPASQKERAPRVNLETKNIPTPPVGNPDLNAEVTKNVEDLLSGKAPTAAAAAKPVTLPPASPSKSA